MSNMGQSPPTLNYAQPNLVVPSRRLGALALCAGFYLEFALQTF